ncbi:MAG: hypothetical protein JWM56_2 [Candidatus Peribacteria bacterium]|nr:hypothetical protein [Candidatus Peribacteria bacterium]
MKVTKRGKEGLRGQEGKEGLCVLAISAFSALPAFRILYIMTIRHITSAEDLTAYDTWIKSHPQGTLWQSLEWRSYQEVLGRKTRVYIAEDDRRHILASALVVIDRTSMNISTWDIPRGPVIAMGYELSAISLVEKIRDDAKKEKCLSLFLSPAYPLKAHSLKLTASFRHQQPDATIHIHLTQTEDELLAHMHQKGRYNIRLAAKNGVTVEQSADVYSFYQLVKETAQRDGFTPPPMKTYEVFLRHLPGSFLMLAYAPGIQQAVAGLMGVLWNGTGIYYYGASSHEHRALMAPSLLQWETMKFCKTQQCHTYDLFGIAPPDSVQHPWAGVTDFKRKFGGETIVYPPEQQITLRPLTAAALKLKRRVMG